jgi:hypothetical protein
MTRGQLRTLTLGWLNDLNAGFFTEDQINTYLNNAQKEAQKKLLQAGEEYYTVCVTTPVIPNQDCYALPSDFRKLAKLKLIISGFGTVNEEFNILTYSTPMELDAARGQGRPELYTIRRNCIILKRTPDSSPYYLGMLYAYMVSDMTSDTQEPDVPPAYHEYLALLATRDGLLRDERAPSNEFLAKLDSYEKLMVEDSKQRDVSAPRYIVSTDDEYVDGVW